MKRFENSVVNLSTGDEKAIVVTLVVTLIVSKSLFNISGSEVCGRGLVFWRTGRYLYWLRKIKQRVLQL